MSKLVRLNPPTAPMSKCLTQITRSHPAFHDVLLTESQASLRIVDLTASESAGSRQTRETVINRTVANTCCTALWSQRRITVNGNI